MYRVKLFTIALLVLLLSLFTASCEINVDTSKGRIGDREIVGIEFDKTQVSGKLDESFDLTKFQLTVIYDDTSREHIKITKDMISDKNYQTPGNHNVVFTYQGFTDTFSFYIYQTYEIGFYVDGILYESFEVLEGDTFNETPVVPPKTGFRGEWDQIVVGKVKKDYQINAVYTDESSMIWDEIIAKLDERYQDLVIDDDIELISYLDGFNMSYETSDHDILTPDGKFTRPYEAGVIGLTVTIEKDDETLVHNYALNHNGYRSLTNGIASTYLYRNYPQVTEEFFDTMDVIYPSFIRVDVNGDFVGNDSAGDGVLRNNNNVRAKIETYLQPKAKKLGIYIVPSIQSPSATFSMIAADATLRHQFALNIVKLINDNGYDGIDIDWETPSSSEKANFTLMMQEIYTAVKANNPHHIITAAIGGGKWQPPRYDLVNSKAYLDYINMMCYSMCSNSGYYHNALYGASSNIDTTNKCGRTLTSCSIDESVTIYHSYGIPNSQIIISFAFYGVRQTKTDGSWSSGSSIFYDSIKNEIASGKYTYHYDERCQVPYLISNDGNTFISYDDERSIIAKCTYCKENGLAGLMYWENGCDTSGDLVHAFYIGMKGETNNE